MIVRACMAVLLLITPMHSWGWDEEHGVPSPKIEGRLPAQLNITRVDVTLEDDHVFLHYHGSVSGKPLPSFVLSQYGHVFGWQGVAADYPDQHFPELNVRINGNLVLPKPRVLALFEGRDITSGGGFGSTLGRI